MCNILLLIRNLPTHYFYDCLYNGTVPKEHKFKLNVREQELYKNRFSICCIGRKADRFPFRETGNAFLHSKRFSPQFHSYLVLLTHASQQYLCPSFDEDSTIENVFLPANKKK